VLLYELATGGSVPYASFSNAEVKAKVSVTPVFLTCWEGNGCFPHLQNTVLDCD